MLSEDAQAALRARQDLQAGLSPAVTAAIMAQNSQNQTDPITGTTEHQSHLEAHRRAQDALYPFLTRENENEAASHHEDPPVGTDDLRGSVGSDLRKHPDSVHTGRTRDTIDTPLGWSQKMIVENKTLHDLLFDSSIPTREVTSAVAANLNTKFPGADLLRIMNLNKHWREKSIEAWRLTALSYAIYYRQFKKNPTPEQLCTYLNERVHVDSISQYFADPNFDAVLEELGITAPHLGLTEKQLLALSMIASFTDARPLSAKLKSIGVKDWEFQNWLGYPKFQAAYRKITEDQLNEVQPIINTSLIQLATGAATGKPDLSAIKYVMEVNGRWDPQSRQILDIRSFMTRVVDVLSQELADQPEKLQRIGQKLAAAAQLLNTTQNAIEGSSYETFDSFDGQESAKVESDAFGI